MKKHRLIFLSALGTIVIAVAAVLAMVLSPEQNRKETLPPIKSNTDTTPVTSDTADTTFAAPLPSRIGMTLEEILRAEPYYDVDEALAEATKWIQSMCSLYQKDPDSFSQYSGWVDYAIADIVPTHSQKTGFITGFVFEIVSENGERSYLFYDFATDTVVEDPCAASPFLLFSEEIENDPWLLAVVGEVKPENVFYFAHPREGFEYGILQEDGSVILYAANYYLNSLYYKEKDLHCRQITIDDLWPESDASADTTPAETTEPTATLTVPEILAAQPYDVDEAISYVAQMIDTKRKERTEAVQEYFQNAFASWDNCRIERIVPVHSFETGYITGALFDIVGEDGKRSFIVYSYERGHDVVYAESESSFRLFETEVANDPKLFQLLGSPDPEDVFCFHHALSFGYGVLQEDGSVMIYDIDEFFLTKWSNPHLKWTKVNKFKPAES